MLTLHDSIAGEAIAIHYCETKADCKRAFMWANNNRLLALDTESTGLNPYHPHWKLRMFQFGHATRSFVIPARFRYWIAGIIKIPRMFWVGHNGPHDMRCIDVHLDYETGVVCKGETYLPGHHKDPRNVTEGGISHGLKEQCEAHIDGSSGKWEKALKARFKEIQIPIPGEFYKSGNARLGRKKGDPKFRKAKLSEGWALIDPTDPAYIAYAGADPILTFRLWQFYKRIILDNSELYYFDHQIQQICDTLQRRGLPVDVDYATRYREALYSKALRYKQKAKLLGCDNIYSTDQVSKALQQLGTVFTEKTPTGKYKADDKILRKIRQSDPDSDSARLVTYVLTAKRLTKRADAYADAMLRERDGRDRVHPSINSIAARTTRMSVSSPPLQQLPTKENE